MAPSHAAACGPDCERSMACAGGGRAGSSSVSRKWLSRRGNHDAAIPGSSRQVRAGRIAGGADCCAHLARTAASPSCSVERTAGFVGSAQARGRSAGASVELGEAPGSGIRAASPQHGQCISPRSPVRGRGGALGALQAESAELGRQQREPARSCDVGVGVILLTKQLEQAAPDGIVVAARVASG